MIARGIDGRAQQALQPVPRSEDLPQRTFFGDTARAIDSDTPGHFDAEVRGAGAARLQGLQQFGMAGDAGAAADQLDARALVDVDVPADLPQERGGKQPRHRAANDDGPPLAATNWGR